MRFPSTALAIFALLSFSTACSGGKTSGTSTNGSGSSSGGSSGMSDGSYTIVPVDTAAAPKTEFAMAIGPNDQVGIVYFRADAGMYAGFQNNSVFYSQVQNNAVQFTELVNVVNLQLGATVAFQPNGQPAIGYLGGGDYNGNAPDHDAGPTGSLYWVQSQAELDFRNGTNSWTYDVCMASTTGGDCQLSGPTAGCGAASQGANNGFNWAINIGGTLDKNAEQLYQNPFGMIVGLWPSLLFDGGTAIMAFRDVHEGQYPIQDWGASATKTCIGGPGGTSFSWSAPMTVGATGDNKYGGTGVHNQLIYGPNGLLAVINDSSAKDEGILTSGAGPINFTVQTGLNTQSNSDWTPPIDPFNPTRVGQTILDPGTGASMVYDPIFGYGVVVTDISSSTPTLSYVNSTDPQGQTWTTRESVYGLGSGGFFPQLAVSPGHNPIVSFTICSQSAGKKPDTHACSSGDQELDTAERTNQWNVKTELTGNFWTPKFGYLSTGKKVFVYSDLDNGGLYVAFEN